MDFIIKRKTLVSMLFLGLAMLGLISYRQLDMELTPNPELPALFVSIGVTGEVDPSYLENQAILPLEGVVGTMEGIEEISSFASSRNGMIAITYTKNVDLKYAYLKLNETIQQAAADLPDEFKVQVMKINQEDKSLSFMELQVRGSGGVDRVRHVVEQKIKPELENIDGVATVTVYGGREKSVEVILDDAACQAHNISANRIRQVISSNINQRQFAGKLKEGEHRFFVYVKAEYEDIANLENLVINNKGIRLKDVASVFYGVKEPTSLSRVNGKDAVTVLLVRDAQSNLIDLSHKTQGIIKELNKKYLSQDVEIVVQTNQSEELEKNILEIIQLALTGALLAVLVLWGFLRSISLVSVVGISIPLSVFIAFNFFYGYDITLNSLTLAGLALAVGMLLDNSVVVLENIYRKRTQGSSQDEAALKGTWEVWRSIFAATLTTITVFLPFLFTSNILIALYGKNIGVSVISTLLISLVVALVVIPMATHWMMQRVERRHPDMFRSLDLNDLSVRLYLVVLKKGLRTPARTVVGALVLFFVSLFGSLAISFLSTEEAENLQIPVYVTMSGGATLDNTDQVVSRLEEKLEGMVETKDLISRIEEEEAVVSVILQDDYKKTSERDFATIRSDVEGRIRDFKGAEVSLEQPASSASYRGGGKGMGGGQALRFSKMLGFGQKGEQILVKGLDFEMMRNVSEDLKYYLDELEDIRRVSMNVSENDPQVRLAFDQYLMAQWGISPNDISGELNTFGKEYPSGVQFQDGLENYEIIIKMASYNEEEPDKTTEDLKKLQIESNGGGLYKMTDFTNFFKSRGMATINRVNQEKEIQVDYSFSSEIREDAALLEGARGEVQEIIDSYELPAGVALEVVHEEADLEEFKFLIGIAFLLIYMILAAVFESFSTPVVLMLSIPLAAAGSFLALMLTGHSLNNANTLIGLLILLGVVVNNGIILIDYTQQLRRQGNRRARAIMVAGMSRLRPIMITALTTMIGMLPLAMGESSYVKMIGSTFAITVIGGLALSTLLTLVVIPSFYLGMEETLLWFRRLPLWLTVLQLVAMTGGLVAVFMFVYDLKWQLLNTTLIIAGVPTFTWFLLHNLRTASAKLIDTEEPISIEIRNLVKIYERSGRFKREWRSAHTLHERGGRKRLQRHLLEDLIWQLPLVGFLVYFTYFYLDKGFWVWCFSNGLWLLLLLFSNRWQEVLKKMGEDRWYKVSRVLYQVLFWGGPVINLIFYQLEWENTGFTIFSAILLFLGIGVFRISKKLQNEQVNVNRLEGRFRGIRKVLYRIVLSVPVIGKRTKPFKALKGVNLEIGTGMFGLLGPNGAGKSTLMKTICGILDQSYGKIFINGHDTLEKREELQGLIGYLPQEFGMYENMTAWEYLDYQGILRGIVDRKVRHQRMNYVLNSVHMHDRCHEKIGSFSGGMKQRIGIAQILLHLPRILVVDEPTAGLDPRERIRFRNLLVELSRERIVIFSTHVIEDISSSCNRAAVINKGELKYVGSPGDMSHLAEGKVWSFFVTSPEFEQLPSDLMVVHHMREGDMIRVRCLAAEAPVIDATCEPPILEDAYLWLLTGGKKRV